MKYYDKLIFELSKEGRSACTLPLPDRKLELPETLRRSSKAVLPQVSEADVVRHYTNLSQMNFGVDTGFYPLGSCTMKYNPKINEEVASLPGFRDVHPLQPGAKGYEQLYEEMDKALASITGMAHFTFLPSQSGECARERCRDVLYPTDWYWRVAE